MPDKYIRMPGTECELDSLTVKKAHDLAHLLAQGAIAYATFAECLTRDEEDVVIFDVEVELGQLLVNPVERVERVAAVFRAADDSHPQVFALRADFPNVPHLALQLQEFPRSLCLYEEPYSELKRHWTPPRFVERIRVWFAKTAKGTLHADDQPLEPLLWGTAGRIVLPADVLSPGYDTTKSLRVVATDATPGCLFLVAFGGEEELPASALRLQTIVLRCEPQTHGVIRFAPTNLEQLAQLTESAGVDLLGSLRSELGAARAKVAGQSAEQGELLGAHLNLILILPKTRRPNGPVEACEVRVFVTHQTIREVGKDVGLWSETESGLGHMLVPPVDCTGKQTSIDLLNPVSRLSREQAQVLNGLPPDGRDLAMACVGAGALGSQTIINMARAGFGRWTVVDDDYLLPHNLARHVLPGRAVGFRKALCVAQLANGLTDGDNVFSAIVSNVLQPGNEIGELAGALADADVILDASASVEVSRHLCLDVQSKARRVSAFLNPAGTDLVLLAEDRNREYQLDFLEMQYYRALAQNEKLKGHFTPADARRRYGQSCRDVTSRIPQDAMALHAAISSRALRNVLAAEGPQIAVWRADDDLSVRKIDISPAHAISHLVGHWRVVLDDFLLDRLHDLRLSRLPNETGGVLIGSFDLERRVAYLVDMIPSPPDSSEWPQLYIRGSRGLAHRVEGVEKATDGALHYVGEWHSHPTGFSTVPSQDDVLVFAWLTERMNADGLPALMMIVGDPGRVSCFLGRIARREELLPE